MKTTILATACLLAFAGSAASGQILNGGFETGDFTSWAYSGNIESTVVMEELTRDSVLAGLQEPFADTWDANEGDFFAALWSTDSVGGNSSTLTQTFSAGAGFTLSFSYFFDFGDFSPFYDTAVITLRDVAGAPIETLVEINTAGNELGDDENIGWTDVSYVLQSSGDFVLEFVVTDADGTFESILGVDNVDVIPGSATTLALAGFGLITARRRRN